MAMPILMQAETPTLPGHKVFNSLIIVSLCTLGTGYGLPWYDSAPSFSSKEMGLVFQSPIVFHEKVPQIQ
jgi:hypothetical protein